MTKKLIISASIMLIFAFSHNSKSSNSISENNIVYVCGMSKIYHDKDTHNALGNCLSGISKIKESEAKNLGKRKCKCRY